MMGGIPIQTGDLMYFTGKGQGGAGVHHATIISKIENNMIHYSGHTGPCLEKTLTDGFIDNPNDECVYIIRIKDSN